MVVWDKYQKAVERAKSRNENPPPYPNDPHTVSDPQKKMKQKPRKPSRKDIKSPMVQCMYSTAATCVQVGTDIGSNYFVKCRISGESDSLCNVVDASE